MRALARAALSGMTVCVENVERVPSSGPGVLVCRHYHHLYDGLVLLTVLRRPVRMLVALDWARSRWQRWYMETLCRVADWPVVLRDPERGNPWGGAYRNGERFAYVRSSLAHSLQLLERSELLAMFPEAYPVVDPVSTHPRPEWPPFEGGYLGIALRAGERGIDVPLVPVGFAYEGAPRRPNAVTVRFGEPERVSGPAQRQLVGDRVESCVRALSNGEAPGAGG